MARHVLRFAGLSERERRTLSPLPKLAPGDRLELQVRRGDGQSRTLTLPSAAVEVLEAVVEGLRSGERLAVLAEDRELSPTEASAILGISRPLVVLRMDRGDLPFRYVGKHRRTSLKDVLALKTRLDAGQKALDALTEDTETLIVDHGL